MEDINARLVEALKPIAPTVGDQYEGDADTYIVFNYNSVPSDFGDDEPGHEVFSVQVHFYCPGGANNLSQRCRIKTALTAAGFTAPSYVNASDKDGQHHVFECQLAQAPGVD